MPDVERQAGEGVTMPVTDEERRFYEGLVEAHEGKLCPRCGCCEMEWVECHECGGEGWVSRYEEDPLWYDEDDLWPCHICEGEGGWWACLGRCDENGKHEKRNEAPKPV